MRKVGCLNDGEPTLLSVPAIAAGQSFAKRYEEKALGLSRILTGLSRIARHFLASHVGLFPLQGRLGRRGD